jgi:hypothetical protein
MQLKRWLPGALVALTLLVGVGARPAQACSSGSAIFSGTDLLIGMGALAAAGGDIAFSVGDLALAANRKPAPLAWAEAEVLVAAPQVALLGWWTASNLKGGRDATLPAALTLWTAAMVVHGTYYILRPSSEPETEPPSHAAVDWKVAPALVSAGQARAAPGAVVFGRF